MNAFNRSHRMIALAVVCGCLCAVFAGCSGRSASDKWKRLRHKTYPVQVLVTWNGEPAKDTVVVFESTAHSAMAVGRTDGFGACRLKTYEPGDGAVAGEHRVRIEQFVVTGTTGDGRILDASIMPKQYADASTSGLTAEVTPTGKNNITFEVSGPRRTP
jgi:hypothetical protein